MIDNRNISPNWEYKKLKDLCEIILGQSPPSNTYNTNQDGIPFFQGKADFTDLYPIVRKYCNSPKKIAETNDILLSVRAPVGTTNIANQRCCIGRGLAAIRYENFKFLFYFLKSIEYQLDKKGTGTTFKAISGDIVRNITIPVPTQSEQHQIVSKIEELFSELDKGKQQLETVKQQLKTYRQSVLKWAFEGRFTSVGTGRDLSPGDQTKSQLPEGWKWVKSGDVISTINNGYTPKSGFMSQNEGEIPFIKVYNLNFDGTINFEKNPTYIPRSIHEKELKRSVCYPNDILINIVGPPLGKVSIVSKQFEEWNINQAIVLFRPNEKIISKFISYFLQNPSTINWLEDTSKATAGQWNVKVSTCRLIPIPLPPVTEQEKIVQEIESRLSICDKMEETIETSLRQAESLRQSILKQAFEGIFAF